MLRSPAVCCKVNSKRLDVARRFRIAVELAADKVYTVTAAAAPAAGDEFRCSL